MELKVNQKLFNLIPPLSSEEINSLLASLKKEGCRESIIVWRGRNIIVDGHNRYAICKEFNIQFSIEEKEFKDENEVMIWMINNQFSRRNLLLELRLDLVYQLRKFEQELAKKRMLLGKRCELKQEGVGLKQTQGKLVEKKGKTLENIARKIGTSYDTIFKYDSIQRKGTKVQKEDIRTGRKKIGTIYKELKNKKSKKCIKVKKKQLAHISYDIEKLIKNKEIENSYLLLYVKNTAGHKNANLSNCCFDMQLKICVDFIIDLISNNSDLNRDDIVEFRSFMERIISN